MVSEIRILAIIDFSKFKYLSSGLGIELETGIESDYCLQGR
jgi:hypothetical protein